MCPSFAAIVARTIRRRIFFRTSSIVDPPPRWRQTAFSPSNLRLAPSIADTSLPGTAAGPPPEHQRHRGVPLPPRLGGCRAEDFGRVVGPIYISEEAIENSPPVPAPPVLDEVAVRHEDQGHRSLVQSPNHQVLCQGILDSRVENVVDERRSAVRREQEQPRIWKRGDVTVGRRLPTDQIYGEPHETRFLDGKVDAHPGHVHPLDGVAMVVLPFLESVYAGEADEEQRKAQAKARKPRQESQGHREGERRRKRAVNHVSEKERLASKGGQGDKRDTEPGDTYRVGRGTCAPEADRLYGEEHGGQRHQRRDFGVLAKSECRQRQERCERDG